MAEWIPVTEQPKPGQYLVHKLYDPPVEEVDDGN